MHNKNKETGNTNKLIKSIIETIVPFIIAFGVILIIGCPFRTFLGIPCPGCGMTRALKNLLRGHISTAIYYHPLILTMPFFLIALIFRQYIPKKAGVCLIWMFFILMIGVYIIRVFIIHSPVTYIDIREGLIYKIFEFFVKLK